MEDERALVGGGPSGRFWYARSGHVSPDALVTLSLLLTILSQSDRPLSRVLDEAAGPG
jgi:phosphomannomutase